MKKVESIFDEGLEYIDDSGNKQWIDFNACYNEYLRQREALGELYTAERREIDKKWRRIGNRDLSASPPFIEFFTQPVTRFNFDSDDEFHKVRFQIKKAGWRTFDLG